MTDVWCSIYKHPKKDEMYLYVKKDVDLNELPQELTSQFANPAFVMDLLLTKDRKLARENIETVIENINSKGFHLQLPPVWGGYQPSYKE
jgi:uncharacterized protein